MHLHVVKIQNFRNIADIELHLRPGLNTFVGPNNIGKTNIFAAIRHALGASSARGESLWLDEDDIHREQNGNILSRTIRISLQFKGLNENQRALFFEILDIPDGGSIENALAKVHFEATWVSERNRFSVKRWGASDSGERSPIPNEILDSLPITFLPALRDAEQALTPGMNNRLARLFQEIMSPADQDAVEIVQVFGDANSQIENKPTIQEIQQSIRASTNGMSGVEYKECTIKAASPELNKILRTLSLKLTGSPVQDISSNGMGYNNLLYIATVLAHLERINSNECPILLIEEPEAHLHPQLTVLLSEYLQNRLAEQNPPQALVSTHSPSFVSNVKPSCINVLYKGNDNTISSNSIAAASLNPREEKQLQRMLDVTRATLYFCKGLILVEGISEALLIPALAKRMTPSVDLAQKQISVLPIAGVSFSTFRKLFSHNALGIPVAIISDADPETVPENSSWHDAMPATVDGQIQISPRSMQLQADFLESESVEVFLSKVTLEYDLADASTGNPDVMASVWESCFEGRPGTFNTQILADAGANHDARVLAAWRGICKANHTGSKAHFAHLLAEWIDSNPESEFSVPEYIQNAINHAIQSATTV